MEASDLCTMYNCTPTVCQPVLQSSRLSTTRQSVPGRRMSICNQLEIFKLSSETMNRATTVVCWLAALVLRLKLYYSFTSHTIIHQLSSFIDPDGKMEDGGSTYKDILPLTLRETLHLSGLDKHLCYRTEYNANDLNNDLNTKTNIRPRQSLEAEHFAEIIRQQQQIIQNYYSGLTTNLSNFVKENSDISSKLQRSSRI